MARPPGIPTAPSLGVDSDDDLVITEADEHQRSALVVADTSVDLSGIARCLRSRGTTSIVARDVGTAMLLTSQWKPHVAIVVAGTTSWEGLLPYLDQRGIGTVVVGDHRQLLHAPRQVNAPRAEVIAPAQPLEVACAAEVIAKATAPSLLPARIKRGRLNLDMGTGLAFVDGQRFELPPKEFKILAELALKPGEPISSRELVTRIWSEGWATGEDVRRHIYRLRTMIGDHERVPPLIRNRRGFGYFVDPASTKGP